MLVILIMGASAMLLNALNSTTPQLARARVTADALIKAKEALIGYAITYGDTHTNVSGFLPCPDQGQNNTEDGEANNSCSDSDINISAIGKLPWKTLRISPIKDGNGECFWYAVSGTYKNKIETDLMNWDNNGLFKIMAPDGVSFIAGSSAVNQPVAVIFSPGPALGTQSRNSVTKAPSCGGNYTSSNYLDNDTIHNINNASISATANTVTQFISGQVKDLLGNEIVNDRLLFITRDEIFNAIKKRNDFESFLTSSLIGRAVTCLNLATLPDPISINFDTMGELPGATQGMGMNQHITGRIKESSCTDNSVRKWRDNLAYTKCSSGMQCLTINSASCRGAIIFTGQQSTSQSRISNIQKNDWNNYLEGGALNIFTSTTTSISGASATYTPTAPSTDLVACIP
ncbi:MAG TPA: hypothetical protein VMV48_02770 [Gallionellaceae bacterium]|nr:hypothetical protein [Gallionellaceae bacterium]